MASHAAFFYGTLMAAPVLYRVIWGQPSPPTDAHASLLTFAPAILHGHQRHRVCGADYPAVVPASSDASVGTATPCFLSIQFSPFLRTGKAGLQLQTCVCANKTPSCLQVRGTLVTGLTDADMWRLDIFEGCEYTRNPVRVHVFKPSSQPFSSQSVQAAGEEGEEVAAETYIWVGPKSDLESQEWDFDEFVREKMGQWAGTGEGRDPGFEGRQSIRGTAPFST